MCGALWTISGLAAAQESRQEPAGPNRNSSVVSPEEGEPASATGTIAGRLSDRGELDRIIELYLAGRYQPCAEQLGVFLDPKNPGGFEDEAVVERGRLYFASCSLLQGQHESARSALRKALEQNPLMQSPDSLTFPAAGGEPFS